jgi:predicted nuclease of predicted toxin-antitoxin system
MKLLFDQNLAPGLVRRLADLYPGSSHVFDIELGSAEDRDVWAFAREHGFVITSKDSDFHHLSVLKGPPPKVIWVRLGNCTVADVEKLLRTSYPDIAAFGETEEAFLVIGSRI